MTTDQFEPWPPKEVAEPYGLNEWYPPEIEPPKAFEGFPPPAPAPPRAFVGFPPPVPLTPPVALVPWPQHRARVRAPRALTEGRQQSAAPDKKDSVLSSVFFKIWCPEGSAFFSELGGVSSEMEQSEYVESGAMGPTYSRHGGRSRPPTITLKRAMKTGLDSTWIWSWHQLAKRCLPGGLRDPTLMLYGAGDDLNMPARVNYTLVNAFPTKIELTGMKLGGTEVVTQTMILQCDDILDINAY